MSAKHSSRRQLARRVRRLRTARHRRGVLLLVVLSLLVLFLMIGTAFIITAKQADIAGKTAAKASDKRVARAATGNLLDDVLLQLVRDTDNPNSSLRTHSLLGDLYGDDGFKFQIRNVQWAKRISDPNNADPNTGAPTGPAASLPYPGGITGGQMIQFEVDTSVPILDFYDAPFQPQGPNPNSATTSLSLIDGAYNGRVLTFLNGPSKGVSTRIVSYHPISATSWQFTVLTVPLADGTLLADARNGNLRSTRVLQGSRVLVNGSPFNGTGVGLNPVAAATDPKLDAGEIVNGVKLTFGSSPVDPPIALLPNMRFFNPDNLSLPDLATPATLTGAQWQNLYFPRGAQNAVGRGGSDETYDAADFQNMFLALMTDEADDYDTDLQTYFASTVGTQSPGGIENQVLPSFHRPELIRFWSAQPSFASGSPDVREGLLGENPLLLRKIMLRPNWLDHPLFTGSNPQLQIPDGNALKRETNLAHMIYGPWDVDNDNDGVRDSVWIDAGLPVVMGPHGKLVKPLVAMLVIDMDGRLNVNAHGSADLAGAAASDITDPDVPLASAAGDNTESDDTPRGIGWGPADISLEAVIGENSFRELFVGHAIAGGGVTRLFPGRMGRDNGAGRGSILDLLPQITQFGWPQWGRQSVRSSFALSPDLRARYGGTGLNSIGQVVYEANFDRETSGNGPLTGDSPYESSYLPEGFETDNGLQSLDTPFSLGELERVLRAYDADMASLPERLAMVSGVFSPDTRPEPQGGNYDLESPQQRMRITTDSWDSPAPNFTMPKEMEPLIAPLTGPTADTINPATGQPWRRLPQTTAELVEIRVRAALNKQDATNFPLFPVPLTGDPANTANATPAPPAARLRMIMRQILAPELAAGVRLNVNRPLGNGRDDNANGVVDEPGEDAFTNAPATNPMGALGGPRAAWAASQTDGPGGMTSDTLDPNFLDPQATFKPLDVTFDGEPLLDIGKLDDRDAMLQRQLLARHLYVMALTMSAPATYFQAATVASTPPAELAYCREVAQWAVNAVDFRDADGIMTPFEYDLNPFDGWQPDGDLRSVNDHGGPDGLSNFTQPNTQLDDTFVWGAERPELVMTETLAWHDRRTQDLANEDDYPPTADPQSLTDPNLQDFDPDYDQLVRPRGAFFVELYNPNAAMPGASADTHDIRATGNQASDWGVKLSKTHDNTLNGSPVWRMAIYKRTPPGANGISIAAASLWDPDDRNVQEKDAMGRFQVHRPSVVMDRSVYFTTVDPATSRPPGMWDEDGVAFFANDTVHPATSAITVRPGRYLVVGGGRDLEGTGVYSSPLGDVVANGVPLPGKPVEWKPRRRIDLSIGSNHAVRLVDFKLDGSAVQDTTDAASPFSVEAPAETDMPSIGVAQFAGAASVADVAIIDRVWDDDDNYDDNPNGGDGNRTRPLTISEPARGYIDRFINTEWIESRGFYGNPGQTAVDVPLDGPVVNNARTSEDIEEFLETRVDDNGNSIWSDQYPIPPYLRNADPAVCRVGELGNNPGDDPRVSYAFIFLQRLANPVLPWNPEPGHPAHDANLQVNPYMTVDRMSTDLTVFNGRPQAPPHSPHGYEEDKDSNNGLGTNTNDIASTFSSLERGYNGLGGPAPATYQPSLWFQQRPSQGRATEPRVRPNLYQGKTNNNIVFRAPPFCTLGFLGSPLQSRDATVTGVRRQLQPDKPLHWLTWNNRPYVSGNELMVVPRVRASMLMREFSDVSNTLPAYSPYVAPDKTQLEGGIDMNTLKRQPYGAFAHLEGFFYEDGPTAPAPGLPTHLYRLLDFVGTPSLFAGATTWLNPTSVGKGPYDPLAPPTPPVSAASAFDDPRTDRQVPFNNISSFREPGRVNLNTISAPAVYAGLFQVDEADDVEPAGDDDAHPGPKWDDDESFLSSRRGYVSNDDEILALDPTTPTFFANPFRSSGAGDLVPLPSMVRAGVECTLARSISPTAGTVGQHPLFAATTPEPYRDMSRNPYFRYQPIVRLNNLTTTRSNVFAVWLTIGFFEVEKAPLKATFGSDNGVTNPAELNALYNRVYPEGYQFTKEDGLEEGNVQRLRGFYIIDRSRPAGFIPGQDANAETTIRLHRRIE